ncbi:acyl carrier protein [Mycoplasma feriruminatoris]|uniref:Acyl carrier protein n=1 Tax=Mycoplasma feriruminatoris TaxID=1179777 RepID=A0AAQ3DML0_9MOLU|nr:acyl carrier protein [Mycoplasma feriruminatoris]UKS53925.1 phosphopantetheine attachment site familyprotein [Mycoplasma feriruminatoris]WFQ90834.1 acyl carrier protein [Mycoplasma feriruminatoris]WFQ93353.1 acyl carrier protein [Mycoplasma feriruminatoris]WFQ95013.1 acyl carrier protein [Mycoplasma feriruminatoris]VZK65111.1 Acyl carrier protein [Mycoplasma feriruminatoris]
MTIYNQIIKELKSRGAKGNITKDSEFKSLGLDSLDLMDMVVTLEEKLNIRISDEQLLSLRTIEDLLKVIEELQ